MKTDVVAVTETRKNLLVEIPTTDVEQAVERVARSYGRRAKVPGFRPGKAPARVVRHPTTPVNPASATEISAIAVSMESAFTSMPSTFFNSKPSQVRDWRCPRCLPQAAIVHFPDGPRRKFARGPVATRRD